jgi:hypothetical protein
MKAVVGVFAALEAAERAVAALERQNYPGGDIRIVAAPSARGLDETSVEIRAGAKVGAGTGGIAGVATGGLLGVLAILGVLAPAGCDPLLAVGPLFAVFTLAGIGAAGGMLVGCLVGMATNLQAPAGGPYSGTLVVVRTDEGDPDTIVDILERHGATHIDQRRDLLDPPGPLPRDPRATAARRTVDEDGRELYAVREQTTAEVRVGRVRRPDAATSIRTRPATGPMRSRTKILIEPRSAVVTPFAAITAFAAAAARTRVIPK